MLLINFLKQKHSPLVKLIKLAAVSAIAWMIWHMRIQSRFQNPIDLNTEIHFIINLVRLVGNFSIKTMHNTVYDFKVLKFFGINTWSGRSSSFMQVIWRFPRVNWIKLNSDGVARGCVRLAACDGILEKIEGNTLAASLIV